MTGSLRVAVHAKPRSRRAGVGGRHGDALVVAVCQPAHDGAANRAICSAVAAAFGVPRSKVRLVAGTTSRHKIVDITGPQAELERRLDELLRV